MALQDDPADGLAVDGVADGSAYPYVVEGRDRGPEEEVPGLEMGVGSQIPGQFGTVFDLSQELGKDALAVDLVVLVRRDAGMGAGDDELQQDLLQVARVRPVVVRVQVVRDVPVGDPFIQLVTVVADHVARLGPSAAVFLHLPGRHGRRGIVGHDVGEKGAGRLGLDFQGQVACGAHAHRVGIVDLAVVEVPRVFDIVEEKGEDVALVRVQETLESVFEIVGGHVPAVAPARAFPEVEGPGAPVLGGFPAVGGSRDEDIVGVEHGKSFEQIGIRAFDAVVVHAHVQRLGFFDEVHQDLLVERCGVGRQLLPQAVDHGAFGGLDRGGIVAAAGRCAEENEEEGTDREGVGGHSTCFLCSNPDRTSNTWRRDGVNDAAVG